VQGLLKDGMIYVICDVLTASTVYQAGSADLKSLHPMLSTPWICYEGFARSGTYLFENYSRALYSLLYCYTSRQWKDL